ncbi:hypothetical protein SRHO_G00074390 [Serrasalmus rhombeus]
MQVGLYLLLVLHIAEDVSSPSTKELIIYATVGGLLLLMLKDKGRWRTVRENQNGEEIRRHRKYQESNGPRSQLPKLSEANAGVETINKDGEGEADYGLS